MGFGDDPANWRVVAREERGARDYEEHEKVLGEGSWDVGPQVRAILPFYEPMRQRTRAWLNKLRAAGGYQYYDGRGGLDRHYDEDDLDTISRLYGLF